MLRKHAWLGRVVADIRGQDVSEYIWLLGLLATATAASFPAIAQDLGTIFRRVASLLAAAR